MSGGGGGSQGPHSLAFRVMRLCKPSFQVADQQQPPLRLLNPISDLLIGEDYFSLNNNNAEDSIISIPSNSDLDLLHSLLTDTNTDSSADSEISFWRRFQYEDPSDAMGLSGLLVLPQSFGAIYLGETFSSYISVNNSSLFEAREVIIKAEIQTERQRVVLLDTSKSPVESIRSGGHYDFIVEHDVKELGPHTLVCAATYSDGDGERKYLPQFFKFVVANPLSVRTKVRVVKEDTFLEACLENHTKSNLYVDQVEFEPSTCWKATIIEQCQHMSENNLEHSEVYKIPTLIKAGGIRNYLYQLKMSSEEVARGKVDGANLLGKLQITWRTNLGEPGRLQTQEIVTNPIEHKEVDLRLLELPSSVVSGRPFSVLLRLTNYSERKVGPFDVRLSHDGLAEKVIMINGIWTLVLPEVESLKSTEFNMELIANKPGVQKISGITVSDAKERKTYDSLPAIEIFVSSG